MATEQVSTDPVVRLSYRDFTDERIAAVRGGDPLTPEERAFLVKTTPEFEECYESAAYLSGLSDADLMNEAYSVWADYASTQI